MRTPSPPYCGLDLAPPLADRFVLGVASLTTARYFSAYPSDPASRRAPCPPNHVERWLQVRLACIRLSPSCPRRRLHTFPLASASEALPPLLDTALLIRALEGLEPSRSGRCQRTLWQSLTSPNRASVTTAPRLSTADRQPSRAYGRSGDLPVPVQGACVRACQVLRPRRVGQVLALA